MTGGVALIAAAHRGLVWLSSGVRPPVTAARRGSRGDCPARSSVALLADVPCRIEERQRHGPGHHRDGSAQAVRDHRDHQRPRDRSSARAGSAPTATATRRCSPPAGSHPDRVWAVEGCNGIGRHIAQRLVADGETVLDVPAKLSARARVFATGQGRKTDPVDAHSVAVAALRTNGLRQVAVDDATVALRLLVDRRDELGRARTESVNRLHQLLLELVPGGAKKFLSAAAGPRPAQHRAARVTSSADPPPAGLRADHRTRRHRQEDQDRQRRNSPNWSQPPAARLQELHGIGPSGAARLLGDIGDIGRFASRAHFASWNGTAPIDASSGDQHRHRLSRAGNRRINRVLHIMAIVQLRHDTEGRAYYRRKLAAGKTPMEAMRA